LPAAFPIYPTSSGRSCGGAALPAALVAAGEHRGVCCTRAQGRGTCGAQCLLEVTAAPSRHALHLAEQLHGAHINALWPPSSTEILSEVTVSTAPNWT